MAEKSNVGEGCRVLLIDGNLALVGAVRDVLVQNAFQVGTATSLQEVKEFLAREEPADTVVLDARVGETDGHDILNLIRSHERWKLVRIIMMTSLDSTHDVRRARKAGADDYLFKPVRPERLVEHIVRMATSP